MKTALFTLALGLALAPAAHAQQGPGVGSSADYSATDGTESRNTGFGIKGGYNLASIQGTGASLFTNRDNLKDFHAGVYGQFGFNNFASLMVELLYSRKGYRTDYLGTAARDTRLDYLELPILFVGNLTETLSIHVGPQVSLLTNVRNDGATVSIGDNGFNSLDYGAIAGAEARLGFAKVGARYDWSLGKLYKDGTVVRYNTATGAAIGDNNIRNQVFQLYVGLGFKH
ncbi:porin family protein [Hymenobacter sp. M29]|uniref:Porin family protein n=1 Tax=Hymenobacter mellowenesis TaxID=3063995 RepID=A0ABT9A6I8_9BACT|nr:porin family protein [Hymenobacter sp. M29]MDO7844850.1 porin family protein [Hymenobacter sp. M29]